MKNPKQILFGCILASALIVATVAILGHEPAPTSASEPRLFDGDYVGIGGIAYRLPSRADAERIGNSVEPEKEAPPTQNAIVLDEYEKTSVEVKRKEVSYIDAYGRDATFNYNLCESGGSQVVVPPVDGPTYSAHATGIRDVFAIEKDLEIYILEIGGTMELVAPVRDGIDVREALKAMEPTTVDGVTRDVFLGSRPCLDAARTHMVYYTNWRLAFEETAEAANGGYRLYDLESGKDVEVPAPVIRCLGWSRSGLACFLDFEQRLVVFDPRTMEFKIVATLTDFQIGLVGNEALVSGAESLTAIDLSTGMSRTVPSGGEATCFVVNDITRESVVVVVRPEPTSSKRRLCLFTAGGDKLLYYPLTDGLNLERISWLDIKTILVATTESTTGKQSTLAIDIDEFQKEGSP